MKKITRRMIAAFLAVLMTAITPMSQVTPADAAKEKEGKAKYVSEVKIGMGETEAEAKKQLEKEGFTILKDGSGKLADLNVDAGSKSALNVVPMTRSSIWVIRRQRMQQKPLRTWL